MREAIAASGHTASISHLLSPDVVLVIDIFRALDDFEAHYDVEALDALERRLSHVVAPLSAKSIVSDALLLGFALRCERLSTWRMRPIGSRQATADEYCLLGLVCAAAAGDRETGTQAAMALGIALNGTVVSLSRDIGVRLAREGLALQPLDRRLLQALRTEAGNANVPVELAGPGRHRRFFE